MTHPLRSSLGSSLGSSAGGSRANRAPTARFAALAAVAAVLVTGAGVVFAQPAVNKPKADPRVQTLATDGETVIDLAVQRGQLTHVVLPLGETFTLPPATGQGARCDDETHAWCIVAQGRDLFIKAKPAAKTNNLILVTEKRRFGVIVSFLQIDTLTQKNSSRDRHLQNRLSRTPCAFGAD